MALDIAVTFACGHTQMCSGAEGTPTCATCASQTISHIEAPLPRFTGHVRGPHAEYADLPAQPVTFGQERKA